MERAEINPPTMDPEKGSNMLRLLEPNTLFSPPTKTFSTREFGAEISAAFSKEAITSWPSFGSIANVSAISSPSLSSFFCYQLIVILKLLNISIMSTAFVCSGACVSSTIST
jgi:hypothetical protein